MITKDIAPKSELHRKLLAAIKARHTLSSNKMRDFHGRWDKARKQMRAYLPEKENDALRRTARDNTGEPQYTTMVVPYTYAMTMTAHTYVTSVFMGRSPMMQFSGMHGESETQVMALEAVMDYQRRVGQQTVPYMLWFSDALQYGAGVAHPHWDATERQIAEFVEVQQVLDSGLTGKPIKKRITRRAVAYEGNRVVNVSPWHWFPDPRKPLHKFQEGEFCGSYSELTWAQLVRQRERGIYTNLDRLREMRGARTRNYEPEEFSGAELPDLSDNLGANTQIDGKDTGTYGLHEMVIELIPGEWGLASGRAADYPEKWVFTCDANFQLIIGARPLGAFHDRFPYECLLYEPDAHVFTSRGIPEVIADVQQTMDWLLNSHMFNVRKAVNNMWLFDPDLVYVRDMQNPLPGNAIRRKPAAKGLPPDQILSPIPVNDVTRAHVADIELFHQFGQRALGINDQTMGLVDQGGRKTAAEVRTSSAFSINRLKTVSEFFSANGVEPFSQMLVQNTQQYMTQERAYRLVGDQAIGAPNPFVNVTPEMIMGFYEFVPVDGTMPIDRFAMANLWREFVRDMVQSVPGFLQSYDVNRIIAWVGQLAGLKNIQQFRVQVQPDAAVAAQAQAGNVVPLGGQGSVANATGVHPGQVSGLGPSG